MGKRLGPSVSGRYLKVAAIRGSTVLINFRGKVFPKTLFENDKSHSSPPVSVEQEQAMRA